jgi:site-specific recombinase XerC
MVFASVQRKGGKEKKLPVHHKLEELLDQHRKITSLEKEPEAPLFPARRAKDRKVIASAACVHRCRRTCLKDGSNKPVCRRTFRLTHSRRQASRIFWKMTAPWKPLADRRTRRQSDYETL